MLALLASLVILALGTAQSSIATTPPNLVAAMRGVDPMLSNSLYQPNPGIKNQIFDPVMTLTSSTKVIALNSFVNLEEVNKCAPELSVERVQNYNEFKKTVSSMLLCETGPDGTQDVAAARRHAEAKAACSSENFRKELAVQQFFQVSGGEIILATAECTTHTVSINPFEPPVFTPSFQKAIQILEYNSKSPNDESAEQVFLEFVRWYGTHFSRMTHMGAKIVFLKRFSNRSLPTMNEAARRQCVLESAYETLTPGGRRGNETTLQRFYRSSSERCGGELQDVNMVAIGPLPESSLENWASVVKKDPKPIHFKLDKIFKWFTNSWFQDPPEEYPYDLNETVLYKYFENKSANYCQLFFGGVCQNVLEGCGFNSACPPEQNCLDAQETELGYKCVQKEYGRIVIVGGNSAHFEAIGTIEPPAYPDAGDGNTLSLVGSTLYSCGGTSNSNVCRYLGMNDTTWNSVDIPWSLKYHSAVTIANDIWFSASSKLHVYHTDRAAQRFSIYNTPFSSDPYTSCAVSNGSHTFVIHQTADLREIWLNKDYSKPEEWDKFTNFLETKFSFSCLWFGSEIFVSGGRAEISSKSSITSVEVINVENEAVRAINPLREARRGHQMAVLNGKPAVLGGLEDNDLSSIETYDEQTDSWVTLNDTLQKNNSYFGLVQYRV